jgi:hypothetical protein
MIYSTNYCLQCDICAADSGMNNPNRFYLHHDAIALGWKFCRRKDGQYARTGGKDYCPKCVPATWTDVP